MKRNRSQARIQLDRPIIKSIKELKSDHPLWGYRRIWSYLRYRNGVIIGKNRVYRLMKENCLLVKPDTKLRAKRSGSHRSKPRAATPNQFWGMDMTKIKLSGWGWIYIHIVLDWYTKEIVGYGLSNTSQSSDWLFALDQAVNSRFPNGIHSLESKPKLITDNGCQPTSESFMKACAQLEIKQILTTWNNPKGNADTERVIRTLKEDLVWPYDWNLPFEFQPAFEKWINDYNTDFPHQSLNDKTPAQMMQSFKPKQLLKEVTMA